MNHREPPHPSAAVGKALLCLAQLLLAAGTPYRVHAMPRLPAITFTERGTEATPYLPFNGAPPLRFAQAPTPPKAQEVPATTATPASAATETPGLSSDMNANPVAGTSSAALTEALTEGSTAAKNSGTPTSKSPAPILHDEVRPTVRAEDFLPFFQIPASARKPGDVTLIVPGIPTPPAPGTLQPSSATYTQSPK